MQIFVRGLVNTMVHAALASCAAPQKKSYRKWSENEKEMALRIAAEKGSDSTTVSFLSSTFPETFGNVPESHLRSFRQQVERARAGVPDGRGRSCKISAHCFSEIV